ncbi:dna polymerase iii subunit beta [Leptolyngbya sp. Heron Island J]|uniref:nucleotidyltransferase family protein n=1 Tax=Leptolyngbya sp. Heron Island J TaxID=1385935 RepID=UPI0003B939A0|nr:nucleotidyltransferase domain-containing protein [Leptolyngbya sp. Heron Island J]ESA35045.1 dna polymerase iii subunit beta [Leptolyngbya sp. Heron Island J]
MAKTALELSPEEWKQFSLPQRSITPEIKARWEQAWELIPKLAKLLREEYKAEKVQVFGSAIKLEYFSMTSDIDLAVWGMPANQYFLAATAAAEFDEAFSVDVVDVKSCRPSLLEVIETEGINA